MQEYTAVFQDIRICRVKKAEKECLGYRAVSNSGIHTIEEYSWTKIQYTCPYGQPDLLVSGTGGFKERIILTKPYKP